MDFEGRTMSALNMRKSTFLQHTRTFSLTTSIFLTLPGNEIGYRFDDVDG